jgi:hypothetical protein
MEIGPIVGLRFMPVPRPHASEMDPPAIFDIENLERIGTETFKAKNEESHGGMHDEDNDLGDEEDDDFGETLPGARNQPRRHLNLFA